MSLDAGTTNADPWLSGVLDRPCFTLADVPPADMTAFPADAFITAKRPADDVAGCAALTRLGFALVDTNLTFDGPMAAPDAPDAPVNTRPARADDKDAVTAIAQTAFRFSRFHLDPRIPDALADRTRAAWAANYFDGGRGDAMVVAVDEGGRPVGFLQWLFGAEALTIDLIAVAADARGRGLGAAMVAAGCRDRPAPRLRVGTQAANTASARFYEGLGLRLCAASYVFHWHGPEAA